MQKVKDMTSGKPGKLMLFFALPLMLGNIFQQFYTMVDSIIVGRGVGVQALASVGAADWIVWMVVWLIIGLTQGFSIVFAQSFGEKNIPALNEAIKNAVVLSAVLSILLTVLGELLSSPVLKLLNTPDNIFDGALIYLRIIIGGSVIITFYNLTASLLRALGDSKSPLIAMIIAAAVNIVLDLIFVLVFHWGVAGAAAATVIAQGISGVFCFAAVRRIQFVELDMKGFRKNLRVMKHLLWLGVPIMFQNVIIGVGGMVLQAVINSYGFIFVAGFTATNKMYGILETAAISFGYAVSTFVAQNKGAEKYNRIRKGVTVGMSMAAVTSVVISVIMLVFGKLILSMFISAEAELAEQVLDVGFYYLAVMSFCLVLLYALYVYRNALQGLGDAMVPMLAGVVELFMRVGAALILPLFIGKHGVFYAEVLAWAGACVLLITVYFIRMRKLPKADKIRA